MKVLGSPPRALSAIRQSAAVLTIVLLTLSAFAKDVPGSPHNRSLARSYVVSARNAWSAGNQTQAREKLKLALQADPTYGEAYLLMGLIEFQSGNVATSIQLYKHAIRLQPSSYSAHYNLALSYLREHRLPDGKLELERAVKLDPSQADAAYDLGVVLLELGDPSAAIVHLERSRKLNPHRPDVSFNLVRANLEAGKISEARGEAEAAVSQLGSDFKWNAAVAQLFQKNGHPQDAVNYLRRAALIRPDDTAVRHQLALAYLASGDSKQVLDLIPRPTTADDHFLRGSAYYLAHQYPEADSESQQALSLEPENPQALILRVRLLQRAGEQEAAFQLAEKTIGLAPNWDEPYYMSGVSLFYKRHYSEASQRLARSVELNPQSARAHFLQGIALASQEKVAEAEQAMRRAVALQPKNARFLCHLGILLMRKNDSAAAEQLFRQAVELAPGYGLAHYELGKLLARSSQWKAAAGELNEAVKRDPSLGSAYYQLSRVYARLGDTENSARALAEFQKLYQQQNNESQELANDAAKEAEMSDLP